MSRTSMGGWGGRGVWILRATLAASLLVWLATTASPQATVRSVGGVYPRTSSAAENLIRSADLHIREQQWDAAVELLLRAVAQYGDTVIALPAAAPAEGESPTAITTPLYVNLKSYCQRLFSGMPAAGLKAYRARADGEAEDYFRRGERDRDEVALRWVIENAFCSSWGDDATNLLADLSFQEGHLDEALGLYESLVPEGTKGRTTYPDPSVDLDLVRGKILICRAALGQGPEGNDPGVDLPDREASFAGREGPLAAIVERSLREDGWKKERRDFEGNYWPTFAGNPERGRISTVALDVGALQWSHEIRREVAPSQLLNSPFERVIPPRSGEDQTTYPYIHPIILGDEVLIGDRRGVVSFELDQNVEGSELGGGEPSWRGEDPAMGAFPPPGSAAPQAAVTLTAHGDRVYARLGVPPIDDRLRDNPRPPRSFLLAVERSSQGKLLWKLESDQIRVPDVLAGGQPLGATFGGTPVADDDGVYVSLIKTGPQTMTWIACLDPATGETRWLRFLCGASPMTVEEQNPFRQLDPGGGQVEGDHLLSLHGSTIYYQTDLGALAAVDARTGALRWLATYPRDQAAARDRARHRPTINPALVAGGRVVVAPSDSRSVLCFDASSGHLVWKADPPGRVDHLLGVAEGRLVASGDSVWTIDVATGTLLTQWPDQKSSEMGFGRGLVSESEIYWPTRDRIYILDLATGRPGRRPPIELRESFRGEGGNLVAGEGYLVVAQADRLVVYCQNSRLLRRYSDLIAERPEDAMLRYRLALVAEATGDSRLALESLADAARLASGSDRVDGEPLSAASAGRMHRILLRLGREALDRKEWGEAAELLAQSTLRAPSPETRITTSFLRVDALLEAGEAGEAVALLHDLLRTDAPRGVVVAADAQRRVRADLLIASRLAEIRQRVGDEPFRAADEEAAGLLRRGLRDKDARVLADVAQAYPVAPIVVEALFALAARREGEGAAVEAIAAYKQVVAGPARPAEKARAWLGMAAGYDRLGADDLARRALGLATRTGGEATIQVDGAERRIVEVARRRLEALADDDGGERSLAETGPPWLLASTRGRSRPEVWTTFTNGPEPRAGGLGGLLTANGEVLAVASDPQPEPLWRFKLGEVPTWAARVGDLVIMASPRSVVALNRATGRRVWTYGDAEGAAGPDPFRPADARRDAAGEEPDAKLSGFRLAGDRLYLRRGQRDIVALDALAGEPDWVFRVDRGSLSSHGLIGPSRLLLQAIGPNRRLLLDADTGELSHEIADGPAAEPWTSDPIALGESRAVMALNPRTVVALDLETGSTLWESIDPSPLPRFSPPRLVGGEEALLALSSAGTVRLDSATGRPLWTIPAFESPLPERDDQLILSGERAYVLDDTQAELAIRSIDLGSGKLAWSRSFRKSGWNDWSLQGVAGRLLAVPAGAPQSADGRPTRVPMIAVRMDDGRVLQRLLVPSSGSPESLQSSGSGFLVATRDGLYRFASRLGPTGPADAED